MYGEVKDQPTALVEKYRYDYAKEKWKYEKINLCQPRTSHQTIVVESGLYVVGGSNGKNNIREI